MGLSCSYAFFFRFPSFGVSIISVLEASCLACFFQSQTSLSKKYFFFIDSLLIVFHQLRFAHKLRKKEKWSEFHWLRTYCQRKKCFRFHIGKNHQTVQSSWLLQFAYSWLKSQNHLTKIIVTFCTFDRFIHASTYQIHGQLSYVCFSFIIFL